MTLAEATLAAAGRAALAAALAWALALPLRTAFARGNASARTLLALGAAAVLLMPRLLIGYGWLGLAARAGVLPEAGGAAFALLHVLLLGLGASPLAAGVLLLMPPPPLGATALYCARLSPGRDRSPLRLRARLCGWSLVHGDGRRHLAAIGAVFLLAFQDFELASLLRVPAWTVWLFDAQAGGQPLATTLAQAALPLTLELLLLGGLAALLVRGGDARAAVVREARADRGSGVALLVLGLAFAAVVLAPLGWLAKDLPAAFGAVAIDPARQGELAMSLAVSALASGLALAAALALRRAPAALAVALALPGLCGGLVVGLGVQALFQLPVLRLAYDTAAPLLGGLVLLLLPLALLLQRALEPRTAGAAVHSASLLAAGAEAQRGASRALLLVLRGRRRALLAAVLLAWVAFEVSASAVLAPVAITPAALRLYNLMHYGHSPALSAMAAAALLALLGAGAAAAATWRWVERRAAHA